MRAKHEKEIKETLSMYFTDSVDPGEDAPGIILTTSSLRNTMTITLVGNESQDNVTLSFEAMDICTLRDFMSTWFDEQMIKQGVGRGPGSRHAAPTKDQK